MRSEVQMTRTSLYVSAILLLGAPASGSEAVSPADIIRKAIRAQGGKEKVTRISCYRGKSSGRLTINDTVFPVTIAFWHKSPHFMKVSADVVVDGEIVVDTLVVSGTQGWHKRDEVVRELSEIQVEAAQEGFYKYQVLQLFPLLENPSFKLFKLGESRIEDRVAIGLSVASQGHRELKLYFDKETGLLIKCDSQTLGRGLKMVLQEEFFRDYRDFEGLKFPWKNLVLWNGKKHLEDELTELRFLEKMDPNEFNKP